MIIDAHLVSAKADAEMIERVLLKDREGHRVTILRGSAQVLVDMIAAARVRGLPWSIWHIIAFEPNGRRAPADVVAAVDRLAERMGVDPARAIVVEHRKTDCEIPARFHLHALTPVPATFQPRTGAAKHAGTRQ